LTSEYVGWSAALYSRLHDVLGSVVALTNSVGQVVERYDYDPYGTTTIMDAAAVPLALKPIDPAAADGYYHDHDRDGDIDAADYTDLMDCVNNTPYDPMCIYTHDRTGDRRVDIVDVGVYLAYADDQGLAGGTSAPELVHYGRPLRLQFDADGDGRVDMFDWYAMQTCFTKNTTRCNYLFDDNGDGVVNFYDLANFKQAADGPQGGPGATQWRRKLVASRYGNPFMWTGQRYDATTGQYHFWARTYSPSLGRWMQRDLLEYVDGPNMYQAMLSDPANLIDPFGLSTPHAGGAAGGATIAGLAKKAWDALRQLRKAFREWKKAKDAVKNARNARERAKAAENLKNAEQKIRTAKGKASEAIKEYEETVELLGGGQDADAKRLRRALENATREDIFKKLERFRKLPQKDKEKQIKDFRKTVEDHRRKYKDKPESGELDRLERELEEMERIVRGGC
jgi:RHS repeat-associated protein